MHAYLIGQTAIHDRPEYEKYLERPEYEKYLAGVMDTLVPFGARVLVVSEQVDVLEGAWPANRTVVLEFLSMDKAKGWYESPSYRAIVQHRFKAATSQHCIS
jgi:uncharacterized protein (DUF1330 family)